MRVEPEEFRELPLFAHAFLGDVPLHDVWRLHLRGVEPDPDVREVLELFWEAELAGMGPASRVLFRLRGLVGDLLGWDADRPGRHEASYVHRLSPEDRARSRDQPGSRRGFWTTVYTFEREALGEVINATVRAFLLFALRPAPGGHHLYWAIYVSPVSRLTPLYMMLIDPFRRLLIYPELIRNVEHAWETRRHHP